jgi:FkbM family methyltransferase
MRWELLSEKINRIYAAFGDDESRELFIPRLAYSIDEDSAHLIEMMGSAIKFDIERVRTGNVKRRFYPPNRILLADYLANGDRGKPFVLWGAGSSLLRAMSLLDIFGVTPAAICDSDVSKIGQSVDGIEVISPEKLLSDFGNDYIGLSLWLKRGEVIRQISKTPFAGRIVLFDSVDLQYFGCHFLRPEENEIYIDVGCFNTSTIEQFIEFCDGSHEKIIGIEADRNCFLDITRTIGKKKLERVSVINKGAYSREGILSFQSNEMGALSTISESGEGAVDVSKIDTIANGLKVTMIKMDIEGAELEALFGAEETIKRNRPRLAICVYHKPSDITDILAYILDLVPEYRFYLRQHSYFFGETVLYAIAP